MYASQEDGWLHGEAGHVRQVNSEMGYLYQCWEFVYDNYGIFWQQQYVCMVGKQELTRSRLYMQMKWLR